MNQFNLVGKVKSLVKKDEDFQGGLYYTFDVQVIRNFREADFSFKADILKVYLWKGMSNEVMSFRKIGDNIAIHGRFEVKDDRIVLIAENVEYLA